MILNNDEIREILAQRIDQQKQALGIVVGIIEPNGRRIVSHGHLIAGDPRQPDESTIFEIGSITKLFTSLLLADMAIRHELNLHDPAAEHLPESITMPERNGKPITLLHLATHASGLPSSLPIPDLATYQLPRDPGDEVEYSNLGAGLLGQALAHRAGTSYEQLLQTRIMQPLGMSDTAIALSPSMRERMATGHNSMLSPVTNTDLPEPLAGAGALRSSAHDMLTFLEAFLGYRETPLARAVRSTLEVRRTMGIAKIGLGWILNSSDGAAIAMHDGGTMGFRAFLALDPNARAGVVVLSNAARSGVEDIGLHLLNPNLPLTHHQAAAPRAAISIDPQLLDRYTGRYQLTPNLILEVTREGDRLFSQGFTQVNGQPLTLPKFELFAESERKFFAMVSDSQVTFATDPEGRAISLILHRSGRDMHGPRLP